MDNGRYSVSIMAWSIDQDNEIWIGHNNEDDFCPINYQILCRMFKYPTHIEGLSSEALVPFSRGREAGAEWPRFNGVNPDNWCQITSSPSQKDTSLRRTVRVVPKVSGLDGVHCMNIQSYLTKNCNWMTYQSCSVSIGLHVPASQPLAYALST